MSLSTLVYKRIVEVAIKTATNHDVLIDEADGRLFFADLGPEIFVAKFENPFVEVRYVTEMTAEQWVDAFNQLVSQNKSNELC